MDKSKALSISAYRNNTGVAMLAARVTFNGKLMGHLVRRYTAGYNPRYGAVSKLSGWQFFALGNAETPEAWYSATMGYKHMVRELTKKFSAEVAA